MKNKLEKKIQAYALDEEKQKEVAALVYVGYQKGDTVERIAAHVIVHILMKFHGIPLKPEDYNS